MRGLKAVTFSCFSGDEMTRVVVSIFSEASHGHYQDHWAEQTQKQTEGEKLEGLTWSAELVLADALPAFCVGRRVPSGQIYAENSNLNPEDRADAKDEEQELSVCCHVSNLLGIYGEIDRSLFLRTISSPENSFPIIII